MARKKVAVLIKYDYFRYLENAGLSEVESWQVMKAIALYDEANKLPEFKNPLQMAMFSVIKTDVDKYREQYLKKCQVFNNPGNADSGDKADKPQESEESPDSVINRINPVNSLNADSGDKADKPVKAEDIHLHLHIDQDQEFTDQIFPEKIDQAEECIENQRDFPDDQSFPTAIAVEMGHDPPEITRGETAIVLNARSPPEKSRKIELTKEQLELFHAARLCFESSDKAKSLIYQDRETTAREMKLLKTFVIRCSKMAPEMTADFTRNVLEHFKVLVNGKLKGKAFFTPRSLTTPWIWELVIASLPENEVDAELRESIRGLFK